MKFVQPIRDKRKISAIKKLLSGNPRDLLLFTLGINSALRVSDLLNLRVRDVLDSDGSIRECLEVKERKTGKTKRFELNKSVRKAIRQLFDSKEVDPSDYLFQSREGENKPITRQQAHRILSEAARMVGIKDRVGTHTLRKTFGYHALKSGVSVSLLQWMLNHSSQSITLAYVGFTEDDANHVIRNLNL
jgi:integrase